MTPNCVSLVIRIGHDVKGIWAGHTRHLGRTQKAFGQDTEGIWAGHSGHLGRTQKAFGQDTVGIWA